MWRARRSICLSMLLTLAFWQASFVYASCAMDRAQLGQAHAAQGHDCCPAEGTVPAEQAPLGSPVCLVHLTSDLQALGVAPVLDTPVPSFIVFQPREHAPPAPAPRDP